MADHEILSLIGNVGLEPEVIAYLNTPPSVSELAQLIQNAGLTVMDAIRKEMVLDILVTAQ